MVKIILKGGLVALIDDEDAALVAPYSWRWQQRKPGEPIYVRGSLNKTNVLLHRLIMGAKRGEFIDHRDLNGLNNQRNNLRRSTPSQNSCNRRKPIDAILTKYKGVEVHEGWYSARIQFKGVKKYLGFFRTQEEAARAYDAEATKLHGEFARLNFPHENTKTNDRCSRMAA